MRPSLSIDRSSTSPLRKSACVDDGPERRRGRASLSNDPSEPSNANEQREARWRRERETIQHEMQLSRTPAGVWRAELSVMSGYRASRSIVSCASR